jgi:hypothetical protein
VIISARLKACSPLDRLLPRWLGHATGQQGLVAVGPCALWHHNTVRGSYPEGGQAGLFLPREGSERGCQGWANV